MKDTEIKATTRTIESKVSDKLLPPPPSFCLFSFFAQYMGQIHHTNLYVHRKTTLDSQAVFLIQNCQNKTNTT